MTIRKRIFIVDDDQSVRESLPDLLNVYGFEVETFPSAEEFLRSFNIGQIDCLILDIAMPGMSGPELFGELKQRGVHIPVIFITAHGDDDTRPQMIAEGAVDCLFKPFSDKALVGAIRKALGH